MKNITYLNRNFRFVFEPNQDSIKEVLQFAFSMKYKPRRFLIGAGQLSKYLTEKNAETVIKATEKMKTDKKTIKFRKYGKIEIYVK